MYIDPFLDIASVRRITYFEIRHSEIVILSDLKTRYSRAGGFVSERRRGLLGPANLRFSLCLPLPSVSNPPLPLVFESSSKAWDFSHNKRLSCPSFEPGRRRQNSIRDFSRVFGIEKSLIREIHEIFSKYFLPLFCVASPSLSNRLVRRSCFEKVMPIT